MLASVLINFLLRAGWVWHSVRDQVDVDAGCAKWTTALFKSPIRFIRCPMWPTEAWLSDTDVIALVVPGVAICVLLLKHAAGDSASCAWCASRRRRG